MESVLAATGRRKLKIDYSKLTWMEMSEIVHHIWVEMKDRNPIGINCYAPAVNHAADLLNEIARAEADNFTSECGPKESKRRKK